MEKLNKILNKGILNLETEEFDIRNLGAIRAIINMSKDRIEYFVLGGYIFKVKDMIVEVRDSEDTWYKCNLNLEKLTIEIT